MATVINRYTQQSIPQYNPMSMNELAFAPTFLRQRHDETNAATAQLVQQLGDYDVLSQYQDTAGQFIDPLEQNINTMAQDLAKRGITESGAVNKLMDLSARKQQLFSPRGEVGQLQERTKQYRDQASQIQEFFKDEPILAQHMLGKLKPGEAKVDPETGKLQLGEIESPSYTRHIPQAEIMDRLNTAISSIDPSTLAQTGIQFRGKLGSFNDLYSIAQQEGVPIEKINSLLTSMIAPEEVASIAQFGEAQGLTKEESLNMFNEQVNSMANARQYSTLKEKTFNVKNDLALHQAKKALDAQLDVPVHFTSPSGRIATQSINPYSNMKIGKDNQIQVDSNKERLDPEYWRKAGYNVITKDNGEFDVTTSGVGGSVPVFSSENAKQVAENANVIKDSFTQIKNNNPELRNLSNKKALEKVNQYYENISQRYGTSFKGTLNETDNKALASSIIAYSPNASVYGPEGSAGELDAALDKLGYDNFKEFEEHGHKAFAGLTLFGPEGKPAYEFTVQDSKGNKTSMFIEADLETQVISERSSEMNKLILNGDLVTPDVYEPKSYESAEYDAHTALQTKGFKQSIGRTEDGEPATVYEIDVNPVGSSSQPFKLNITELNNLQGNTPYEQVSNFKRDIAGKTSQEVKRILVNKYGLEEDENFVIEPIDQILTEEKDNVLIYQKQLRNE